MPQMKLKHARIGECALCNEKMKEAHPIIQAIWPFLKLTFPYMHVSWVFRDQVTQDQLVAKGASEALWPKSDHNKTTGKGKPCARAFDLFEIAQDGVPRWEAMKLKAVAEWLLSKGFPLKIPYPIIFKNRKGQNVADWPHFSLAKDVPQP